MVMQPNKDKLKKQAEEHINATSENIRDEDIERVINEEENINKKLKDNSHLERFFTDIQLFLGLVRDYYKGDYRQVPYKTIAAIVAGLLYIANPIDIIPDFIPLIGYIDDAVVIGFCLKLVESDLEKYRAWKDAQAKHV